MRDAWYDQCMIDREGRGRRSERVMIMSEGRIELRKITNDDRPQLEQTMEELLEGTDGADIATVLSIVCGSVPVLQVLESIQEHSHRFLTPMEQMVNDLIYSTQSDQTNALEHLIEYFAIDAALHALDN